MVSASSSSDLRQIPRMWSCATQEAIASCSISIHSWNGIRTLRPLRGAMCKFFPENYMGPIGLSVEEENLRAAPGTPQAAQADGGMLFAKIVPKSNVSEAIRGETFEITLTKGYFTESGEEAKVVGKGAIVPRELDCFEQPRKILRLMRNKKVVPQSVDLPSNCHVNGHDAPHLPRHCAERDEPWLRQADVLLRCLAASGTGAALRIAAAVSAGYGPPVYKEESATPDATVFYLLDQTFNTVSQKSKKGLDPVALADSILTRRTKNDRLRGSPDNRPFKNYEVHSVASTRDNEETSLRMMIAKAYELLDKRTDECPTCTCSAFVAPTCTDGRRTHGG